MCVVRGVSKVGYCGCGTEDCWSLVSFIVTSATIPCRGIGIGEVVRFQTGKGLQENLEWSVVNCHHIQWSCRLQWDGIRVMLLLLEHVLMKHPFERSVAYLIRLRHVSVCCV